MARHALILPLLAAALGAAKPAPAEGAAPGPLLVGISARLSPRESFAFYEPLLGYLGGKLGRRVEMIQFSTYEEMDSALERRDLDFAFLCSRSYVRDHAKFGVELLAAPQSHGRAFYYAVLIVPATSPARSLADLRGRRFAFTDPGSATGRLAPAYQVRREFGVSPEAFFSDVVYAGSHDGAIAEVNAGTVDGASVDSLVYEYLAARHPERVQHVRILAKSPPYGVPPVVANRRADPGVRRRVAEVLLGMHADPDGRRLLDAIRVERFIVPADADYDAVREMETRLAERGPPR